MNKEAIITICITSIILIVLFSFVVLEWNQHCKLYYTVGYDVGYDSLKCDTFNIKRDYDATIEKIDEYCKEVFK